MAEPAAAPPLDDAALLRPRPGYWLTRDLLLRFLGAIYLVAFLAAHRQILPLVGHRGLLPADAFLRAVAAESGSRLRGFLALPSLFWIDGSDRALSIACLVGVAGATAVLLGRGRAPLLAALWALQLSIVHVGQLFWGYGWEILLLEAGFLAIFLSPPLSSSSPPVPAVIWLYRWLLFRVMFGAGLIKLRGDPCWRDLTCLVYHYETQPLPNPLSWLAAQSPRWLDEAGVLWNHFVELVVPWFLFGPRRLAAWAGALTIAFQMSLILSGNLSFLNYLTIALCVACFDDAALARLLPRGLRARTPAPAPPRRGPAIAGWILVAVVGLLSVAPTLNLFSSRQIMNGSFDPLHLVNTYGAFGSIGRARDEIVLEGTDAGIPDERARWRAYELPCKPGDPTRRPCLVAPYHLRLDWQLWFAAMSDYDDEPWLAHLVAKLLENDPGARSLFENDPFPDRPPRYLRATLYEYRFTRFGEPGWWRRTAVSEYLPPTALDDPALQAVLRANGWTE